MLRLFTMLSSAAAYDINKVMRRKKRNAIFLAITGLFALTAFVALVVALGVYLATIFGSLEATLIVAGAAFVLALLTYCTVAIISRFERKKVERNSYKESLATGAALALAPQLLSGKKAGGIVLALAGGYIAYQQLVKNGQSDYNA